jgi:hypothetical protein
MIGTAPHRPNLVEIGSSLHYFLSLHGLHVLNFVRSKVGSDVRFLEG